VGAEQHRPLMGQGWAHDHLDGAELEGQGQILVQAMARGAQPADTEQRPTAHGAGGLRSAEAKRPEPRCIEGPPPADFTAICACLNA